MSGLIEAVVMQAPSAGAVLERFSEFLTRAGVMMRVRREALPGLGPAIRFEVRRLGNLSHLHIEALATILSRTDGLTGVVIVVNGGWKRFVLPTQTEECIRWFRDDRGASTPRVWSAISRVLDGLRLDRG
jgi:hypothetical protein